VNSWFQAFAFACGNLYRYDASKPEAALDLSRFTVDELTLSTTNAFPVIVRLECITGEGGLAARFNGTTVLVLTASHTSSLHSHLVPYDSRHLTPFTPH
jgi:hypothetical protein